MKKLICIKVQHSSLEMGDLDPNPNLKWIDQQLNIFWDLVEKDFKKLDLDYKKIKIYQDGFCSEKDIKKWEMLASIGSRNFQFVLQLVKMGAILVETERQCIIKVFLTGRSQRELIKLRPLRDRYVAKRIVKTLSVGETGILIMGANHEVEDYLPKDIQVFYLKESDEFLVKLFLKLKKNTQP